jgi:hypothetical protein
MVQMDIPAAFAFAQLLAWCGRKRLQQEEPAILGRFTVIAATYALAVIGPCALYLYSGWTEWETMYWFRPILMDTANFGNPLLALFAPLFLVTLAIAAGTGFVLAHRCIRAGKPGRVLIGIVLGLVLSVGVVLVTPSAPMFVGHLENYRAYISDARASGDSSKYGIVSIGPWVLGIPWTADREILARHNLITCLDSRFLGPLLIDSAIYFGCTAALAIWFRRQNPRLLIEMPRPGAQGGKLRPPVAGGG